MSWGRADPARRPIDDTATIIATASNRTNDLFVRRGFAYGLAVVQLLVVLQKDILQQNERTRTKYLTRSYGAL